MPKLNRTKIHNLNDPPVIVRVTPSLIKIPLVRFESAKKFLSIDRGLLFLHGKKV